MKMRREAAKQESGQLLQWYPAFFAGLQIEFGNEAKYLSFEQEHQLGTKPMSIDVLVKNDNEYSNAIVHAFQKFRAPFSGKIVHIFPEQSAVI